MKKIRHSLRWLLLSAPLLFATVLMADETEIYFSDKSGEVAPNVLFLIDASGSMNQPITGDALGRTRLGVLKDSFTAVMNAAPANLNADALRQQWSGGGLLVEFHQGREFSGIANGRQGVAHDCQLQEL
ncbi:MAG: hypothetical protein R3E93_08575 [Thiothrix sp.]